MTFEEYQNKSKETAVYPKGKDGLVYVALGLSNEAGEVLGNLKKIIRDDNWEITDERREALKKELGDVLWYISQLCTELGFSFEEIAKYNLEKIFSRKERGALKGSGDDR